MLKHISNLREEIGQIEYYVIPKKSTLFIQEIAIFGDNKGKGHGEKAIWDLFDAYPYVKEIVGISTGDAIPFWKKIKANISEIWTNGDYFFILNKWALYNYLKEKYGGDLKCHTEYRLR